MTAQGMGKPAALAVRTTLNFDLHFERWRDSYRVRVANSPAGEATARFSNPWPAPVATTF